jgi:FAD/FMN-containing dehydrogenase
VFQPSTSKEVSIAVLLARLTNCPFAARSGGHAAFAGASNSPAGISIWLKNLNDISLNDDKSVASIGPGNTWGQIYQTLEPHGLAVVGGRDSTIGVGGFILGGGISFYANRYGWAVDNVQSFEVTLCLKTANQW